MLMDTDYRRIDQHASDCSESRIRCQVFEQALQAPRGDPSSETVVNRLPVAEVARQITPRDTGASDIEQRLEEHPVRQLWPRATFVFPRLLNDRFEKSPQLVREYGPHGIRPRGENGISFP
jgi:hypothetical protein